jgi:hypothetical protein
MFKWFHDLDRILRGEATQLPSLREGRIDVSVEGLTVVLVLLGFFTGGCVGCFAVFREGGPYFQQLVASTIKVPLLFALTLHVTFPSLYVFNALVGSKLSLPALLRLLVASIGVTVAVLAAFGPIVAFFSVSTTSYPFMVLFNVLVFAISGFLGLKFLMQTLHRLSIVEQQKARALHADAEPSPAPASEAPAPPLKSIWLNESAGALDRLEGHPLGRHVTTVFRCWVIVFGLVGAQMGWVLRPFIGNPNQEFEWFRTRQSNFFEGVWHAFVKLFS